MGASQPSDGGAHVETAPFYLPQESDNWWFWSPSGSSSTTTASSSHSRSSDRRSIDVDEADFTTHDRVRQTMLSQMVLMTQLREFRMTELNYEEGDPVEYMPRAEAPLVETASVTKTEFHVRAKSIRVHARQVRFILDSTVPCSVRATFNFKRDDDKSNPSGTSTAAISGSPKIGQDMKINLPAGVEDFVIDVSGNKGRQEAEWTFWKGGENGVVIKQLIHMNGQERQDVLEEKELFGANEELSLCGICMDREPDTAVLPCRHLCLCSNCAELYCKRVQNQAYRCPMCRERTSSLLQMDRKLDDRAEENEHLLPDERGVERSQHDERAGEEKEKHVSEQREEEKEDHISGHAQDEGKEQEDMGRKEGCTG